jgi:2-amino-4-hydroxy-6-hydroxymethyldihydropteridine diphosphokinase
MTGDCRKGVNTAYYAHGVMFRTEPEDIRFMPVVFVSIGSCCNRENNVRAALKLLRKRFGAIRYSSVYETEAVGFEGDPFLNLVVRFESDDDPVTLKKFFKSVERRCGRTPRQKTPGPVPLDLDLLLYGDMIIETPTLTLPRADVLKHAFVLEPLSELAPTAVYPGTHQTYLELWRAYCQRHRTRALARLRWDPLEQPRCLEGWCYPDYTQAISLSSH